MKKRLIQNLILVIATIHLSGCYAIGYIGGRAVDNMLIVDNQLINKNQLDKQSNTIQLAQVNNSRHVNKISSL